MWSRWAISAPTRPRLSHTPRRIVSISASVFSGKAARRLARPVRCSGSHGPMVRMIAPPTLLIATRLQRWDNASSAVAARPATTLASDLKALPIRNRMCRLLLMAPASQAQDHFAEHLASFDPREAALEIGEFHLGVDHRQHAAGHLGEPVAYVAHRRAERADDPVLLLEQLHQVEGDGRPRGRTAGDEPAAALEGEQRAVEGLRPDMLEYDVDALLGGDLAHHVLEPVLAVVDDVVGAQRPHLLRLGVVADGGDHRAADRLGHLDRDGADAGTAGMDEDGLAGLEPRIVEQHVLDGRECDRRTGGVTHRHPGRRLDDEALGHVDE